MTNTERAALIAKLKGPDFVSASAREIADIKSDFKGEGVSEATAQDIVNNTNGVITLEEAEKYMTIATKRGISPDQILLDAVSATKGKTREQFVAESNPGISTEPSVFKDYADIAKGRELAKKVPTGNTLGFVKPDGIAALDDNQFASTGRVGADADGVSYDEFKNADYLDEMNNTLYNSTKAAKVKGLDAKYRIGGNQKDGFKMDAGFALPTQVAPLSGGLGDYGKLTNVDGTTTGLNKDAYTAVNDAGLTDGMKLSKTPASAGFFGKDGFGFGDAMSIGSGVMSIANFAETKKLNNKKIQAYDEQIADIRDQRKVRRGARTALTGAWS